MNYVGPGRARVGLSGSTRTRKPELVWRYLYGGSRKHALLPGYASSKNPADRERWTPACGIWVLDPKEWMGGMTAEQREKLEEMARCQSCERKKNMFLLELNKIYK